MNKTLPKLQRVFSSVFEGDHRGTFLNDILAFEDDESFKLRNSSNTSILEPQYRDLLWRYSGTPETRVGSIHQVYMQSSIEVQGVTYSTVQTSPGNSCIVYHDPGSPSSSWRAGRIVSIFLRKSSHTGTTAPAGLPLFVVHEYVPLSDQDTIHDFYRKHGSSGGRIFYARQGVLTLLSIRDVLCHFACTPLTIDGIEEDCVHVLPLNRVSVTSNDLSTSINVLTEMGFGVTRRGVNC